MTIDGEGHYSIIKEVSENSVYLADPSKGNIVLSREEFSAIFTGNVLVINGSLNQTAEQTNSSTENLTTEEMGGIKGQQLSAPVSSNMQLTAEEMQSIRGKKMVWKWRWLRPWLKIPKPNWPHWTQETVH